MSGHLLVMVDESLVYYLLVFVAAGNAQHVLITCSIIVEYNVHM